MGNRKMLLIYDGNRSHLGIAVLEKLRNAGVIAYALPSHTIWSTQHLDISVFSFLKAGFRTFCQKVTIGCGVEKVLDDFDVRKILSWTYMESFTHQNITSGFRRSHSCLWEDLRLFSQGVPYYFSEPSTTASFYEIMGMLDQRRKKI